MLPKALKIYVGLEPWYNSGLYVAREIMLSA